MKKIIAFLLVVSMTAAIAIGGTLAYFTDRDSEANVFTVGNVEIDLNEDFNQGAELIPGINVEKKPTVTNVGPNDAWVWATVSVPAGLDSVIEFGAKGATWAWSDAADVIIEGKSYKQYTVLYDSAEALVKGDVTTALFETVALDKTVDIDPDGVWHTVVDGNATKLGWTNDDGNPVIYVSAYAMQKENFATVQAAYEAYNSQWDTDDDLTNGSNGDEYATAPTLVATADELTAALAAGKSVALTADIDTNGARLDIPADAVAAIDLNGHTLTSKDGGGSNTMAVYVNEGAKLTLKDSAGDGKLVASCYGVYVKPGAAFVMDGGTLSVSGNGVYDIGVTLWNAKFVMNGGTIESKFGVWASNYYRDNAGQTDAPTCEVTIAEGCVLTSTGYADIDIVDAPDTILNVPSTVTVNSGN